MSVGISSPIRPLPPTSILRPPRLRFPLPPLHSLIRCGNETFNKLLPLQLPQPIPTTNNRRNCSNPSQNALNRLRRDRTATRGLKFTRWTTESGHSPVSFFTILICYCGGVYTTINEFCINKMFISSSSKARPFGTAKLSYGQCYSPALFPTIRW